MNSTDSGQTREIRKLHPQVLHVYFDKPVLRGTVFALCCVVLCWKDLEAQSGGQPWRVSDSCE